MRHPELKGDGDPDEERRDFADSGSRKKCFREKGRLESGVKILRDSNFSGSMLLKCAPVVIAERPGVSPVDSSPFSLSFEAAAFATFAIA